MTFFAPWRVLLLIPVDLEKFLLFTGFYTSQVVQDFFHQQYFYIFFWAIFSFSIISGVFWSQPKKNSPICRLDHLEFTPSPPYCVVLQRAARRIPGLELWLSGATRQGHPFFGRRCWFGPTDGTMADQNGEMRGAKQKSQVFSDLPVPLGL